jgi:hypothetical protein
MYARAEQMRRPRGREKRTKKIRISKCSEKKKMQKMMHLKERGKNCGKTPFEAG